MTNFIIGLFLLLVLLFFWSLTFWRIVLWLTLGSFWVYAFGYALSLMFNDSSATPYVWGAILGVPLCIVLAPSSGGYVCLLTVKEMTI